MAVLVLGAAGGVIVPAAVRVLLLRQRRLAFAIGTTIELTIIAVAILLGFALTIEVSLVRVRGYSAIGGG